MSAREKNLKRYPWKRKSGREKWAWNTHFAREKMQKKVQNRFSCPLSFSRKKKTLGSNSAREKIIPTRENSEKYARENFFCTREKNIKKAGKCPWKWQVGREKSEKKWAWNTHFAREKIQKKVQNRFSRQKKKTLHLTVLTARQECWCFPFPSKHPLPALQALLGFVRIRSPHLPLEALTA